jgi:tight adherence protein B
MIPGFLSMLVGVVVIVVVGAFGLILVRAPSVAEQRLDDLSGSRHEQATVETTALLRASKTPDRPGETWGRLVPRYGDLQRFYEQADPGISLSVFLGIALCLALAGAGLGYFMKLPLVVQPLGSLFLGCMPFFWLAMRKRRRRKAFIAQMPDALELIGRALRAGHGLASGLGMVAEEMPPPISIEFGRVFEEQNLGIPVEEALRGLAERIPVMDVRFFVTAVIVQRGTGGDLAEVLDKIGRLIRERFQILGQVHSLTAEGRLSGAVLLAMPPALLAFCYSTNPEYIKLLFTTSAGVKMLVVTGVLQLVGAMVIKKIVTIKV